MGLPLVFDLRHCPASNLPGQDIGYGYVNIDDCWAESTRDASGDIVASTVLFNSDGINEFIA
jgi:hypothetical protein